MYCVAAAAPDVYKPTSRMAQQLEERLRMQEEAEKRAQVLTQSLTFSAAGKPVLKKKTDEKRKSNLETFKEELKMFTFNFLSIFLIHIIYSFC